MHRFVVVELLLLRVRTDGLAYRRVTRPLGADHPDGAALELAGMSPGEGGAFLHSTSWRFAEDGTLFLTYAGAPDPDIDALTAPLHVAQLPHSHSATAPHPALLTIEHVAAHAVRHLALLLDTDPIVTAALRTDEQLYAHVRAAEAAPAGQLA